MNANACETGEFFRKQACPVTGLPVLHRPEWAYANPDSDYRIKISILGARVVLSQPSGYATLKDVKAAMGIIEGAVAEGIPAETPYIQVEDYTRLKGVSFAGRKFFIDSRKSNPRISAILFCGVSPLFKMSVRLAKYINPTKFSVLTTGDCAEGLRKAREILQDIPFQEGNGNASHIQDPELTSVPLELNAKPEWHLRLEGFSVQYEVTNGRVIHGVSKGFLEERHIQPIIGMMETVYAAMGSPQGACYCLNGVWDVSGSTRKARQLYYNAMREWFLAHPGFRMYIFYGAGRLLTAAIRMTSTFAPFSVHTAKDLESGLLMIDHDQRTKTKIRPVSPEQEAKTDGRIPFSAYVNELLQYLGSVDWEAKENASGRPTDPLHPFLPVFDGIDLIKSDLDAVLMERNQIERSMVREKQLSESIIDHIPAGVAFLDNDFILRKYNCAYARFLMAYSPYSPEACLGMTYSEYLPGVWEQVAEWYKSVRDTGMPESRHNFTLTFEKGGGQVDTFWDRSIVPVRNASGKVEGILILTTDVTEQKAAEENAEKLKDQLRQAQKMESIGTLAGGIAHDFNNILSAILGYTEISLMGLAADSRLKPNLEKIFQAGERARDLVRQILAFSRQGNPEMVPFHIEQVVKEALQLIRASLPATIDIRFLGGSDAVVMGDSTQIHQVLMNLCTNAGHAMKDGKGILTVEIVDVAVLRDEFDGERRDMLPGDYVRIKVGDTGQGMTQDVMERIFDPYFTTKRKGHGTGMGLAVTHGIVKSHGATITVESELGKGSIFTIFLQTVEKRTRAAPELHGPVAKGDERILLVDDEMSLADMGKKMLENLGYRVEARTSSVDALELFKMDPDRFNVVITDMTMPNMTGVELSQRIMEIRPNIPIILSTGFSELITEAQAKALGINAFISKPILKADLARTVRDVLETLR
jgi:signal transduction histidine kinase/CheY-like chemotaxis protein